MVREAGDRPMTWNDVALLATIPAGDLAAFVAAKQQEWSAPEEELEPVGSK
jgi:hypothetical protein